MLDLIEPARAAEHAALSYVSDTDPGYRRRRAGNGFYYLDSRGARLDDQAIVARIKALAIPPAWTDVWICSDPEGHVQATGRDERGRKQYRYHAAWTICRDEAKFSSLTSFARSLPKLRARVDRDLRRHGLPRERVVASVVRLLDATLIRVGNDSYAQENKSFGLTTLRSRHLKVAGSSLRFSFMGKSGQEWRLTLNDRRITNVVRSIAELPGQRLFQYLDEDGGRHHIRSQDVNEYIRETSGADFTSKHFRTWGATAAAALALADEELPATKRATAITLNGVIDGVAGKLRNTRAVCRSCYIHPAVVEAWQDGRLGDEIGALRRRLPRPLNGLDASESTVLRWLSSLEDAAQPSPG
ncbi:DNA topoisomerase IB [Mesorhizobium sp. CAU 1741]|uniref:DNA topoisomerase IB n=1 Tax=Mesorhizobium sp. CAU 1741 TaxID=3140366 RepID=UPI00325B8AEF